MHGKFRALRKPYYFPELLPLIAREQDIFSEYRLGQAGGQIKGLHVYNHNFVECGASY